MRDRMLSRVVVVLLLCAWTERVRSRADQAMLSHGLCRYGNSVECCWGWKPVDWERCQPHCQQGCKHGECVGPDRCKCHPGYTGKACNQDLNECGTKPRPCKHRCMNTLGSYKCYCVDGYTTQPDGSCRNARTCYHANCQYGCEVMKGGVRCTCPSPGLRLGPDRRTCVDIDECVSGGGGVCPRRRKCVNTFGSFLCKCHLGFRLTYINGRYTCIDKDTRPFCSLNPASPKCRCKGSTCAAVPKVTVEPPRPRTTKTTSTSSLATTTAAAATTMTTAGEIATTTAVLMTTGSPTTPATTAATPAAATPATATPATATTATATTATATSTATHATATTATATSTATNATATTATATPATATPATATSTATHATATTATATSTATNATATTATATSTATHATATTATATPAAATIAAATTAAATTATATSTATTAAATDATATTATATHATATAATATSTATHATATSTNATTARTSVSATPPATAAPTMGSSTSLLTTSVSNRVDQDVTHRQRGDVHIPRHPSHNQVWEFDIELGATAEDAAADDPGGVLRCTFDHGLCDWMSDSEGDLHWGITPDPAGGRYLSVPELKTGQRSIRGARLAVHIVPPWSHSDLCFSFSHWLTGHHTGTLQLFVRKRGGERRYGPALWSRTGGHGWRHTQVSLTTHSLDRVLLKADRRKGLRGQMAVDDVTLRRGACR